MKKCNKCNEYKELDSFPIKRGYYQSPCKECNRKKRFETKHTPLGLASAIYQCQLKSCRRRKHSLPSYTVTELLSWMVTQPNFIELYNHWINSNYLRNLIPSIDRLDNNKSYTLNNIQLVTWRENLDNAFDYMRNNVIKVTSNPQKGIQQLDINNNILNEYVSCAEAGRRTGLWQANISSVCLGKLNQTGGFKWRYINGT